MAECDLNEQDIRLIFSRVYGEDEPPSYWDERLRLIWGKLHSAQRFNYLSRQEDIYRMFSVLAPAFHFESNSEGTSLWLALALAIKEMHNLTDESLIALLRSLQSVNEQ